MRTKCICKTCKKIFYVKLSIIKEGKGKYCSKSCYIKSFPAKIERTCKNCGKTFFVQPNVVKCGGGKFCSHKCYSKFKDESEKRVCLNCKQIFIYPGYRKNSGNNKGKFCNRKCFHKYHRVKCVCYYCGKEFFITNSKKKQGGGIYCSRRCSISSRTFKLIEVTCEYCDKKFFRKSYELKSGRKIFCSKECKQMASRGKNYFAPNHICLECGRTFWRRGNAKYCSMNCRTKHYLKNYKKENHWAWQGGDVGYVCEYCGKKFMVNRNRHNKGNVKYCSKICMYGSIKAEKVSLICRYCGTSFEKLKSEINIKTDGVQRGKYCSKKCSYLARREFDEYRGKNHHGWNGGWFPYYGKNWSKARKNVIKKSRYISELSGNNGGKLSVHHIYKRRIFIQKIIDLCYRGYIEGITTKAFKILPYELIPEIVYDELNHPDNLIVLTPSEHHSLENMPPSFFYAIKNINSKL